MVLRVPLLWFRIFTSDIFRSLMSWGLELALCSHVWGPVFCPLPVACCGCRFRWKNGEWSIKQTLTMENRWKIDGKSENRFFFEWWILWILAGMDIYAICPNIGELIFKLWPLETLETMEVLRFCALVVLETFEANPMSKLEGPTPRSADASSGISAANMKVIFQWTWQETIFMSCWISSMRLENERTPGLFICPTRKEVT